MTSRDSYRSPMTPQDALAELRRMRGAPVRRGAGRRFMAMLEREGSAAHAGGLRASPDFEAELGVRAAGPRLAQPSRASPAPP